MEAPVGLDYKEWLLVGVMVALIVISVVGNCLVCVAIFTERRLRKLGNAFIVSLAIADLLVSCLVMTFALCNDLMNRWIFGDWFCDVWISCDIMCCTASILNLCAISLDRFVHIKDCLLYNQWMTRRVAISAVIIIWFISALVSFVPITLGWHRPHALDSASPIGALGGASLGHLGPSAETKLNYSALDEEQLSGDSRSAGNADEAEEDLALGARWPIENQSSLDVGHSTNSAAAADFLTRQQQQFNQVESNPQDGHRIGPMQPGEPGGGQQLPGTPVPVAESLPRPSSEHHDQQEQQDQQKQQPQKQCQLALTPTYAVISSAISFYIPCIIMLGLYTKLFACARRHVRNIQAISKAPAPLPLPGAPLPQPPQQQHHKPVRAWLKLQRAAKLTHAAETQQPAACLAQSLPQPPEQSPFLKADKSNCNSQRMWARGASQRSQAGAQQERSGQQLATHKAAVTLGIIMGTFLCCWVPFFCLNIIKAFCVDCIPSSLFRAFTWLGYANSALNPIIYGIHNSEFRNAFNRIFFKHLNIKNSRYYINRRLSHDLRQQQVERHQARVAQLAQQQLHFVEPHTQHEAAPPPTPQQHQPPQQRQHQHQQQQNQQQHQQQRQLKSTDTVT